jgi:hypothetical protein
VILTNRLGLPSSIVNAVSRDNYSRGDAHISCTTLVGPARKRMLEMVHCDELTEDVADRVFALFGQVMHGILERSDSDAMTEKRLYVVRHGWTVSGQFDRLSVKDGHLTDYKASSTYSIKGGAKPEWVAQANIYATMLREHGFAVNKADDLVVLRDWQKSKAQHDRDYPQAPVVVLPVELWSPERCEQYILDRLLAHANAQHVLPLCTPEERWERPAKFALVKEGNKRATSLHDSRAEAENALTVAMSDAKKGVTFKIDERPADSIRCRDYCPASSVCEQWRELSRVTKVNFAA